MRATSVRITKLDADGRPTGETYELLDGEGFAQFRLDSMMRVQPTCAGADAAGRPVWRYRDASGDTWEYRGPLIVTNGVLDPRCRFRLVAEPEEIP